MKCDELIRWQDKDLTEYYEAESVDAAIDELKTEHHKERHEYIKMIAELKQKLQDQCISCPVKMQEDDVVAEKDNEIRRLKRALWLARAYRGRDNSILLPSKFMRNVWDNVERRCIKKAEEYK